MKDYYEITHVVGFEETNLVGNVYYANYVRWQGRCREMFLFDQAPGVLREVQEDLKLFTIRVSCEFFSELTAFDPISIRLRLVELAQTQVEFSFEYLLVRDGEERLVATGRQRIACMRGPNGATRPCPVPTELVSALKPYSTVGGLR